MELDLWELRFGLKLKLRGSWLTWNLAWPIDIGRWWWRPCPGSSRDLFWPFGLRRPLLLLGLWSSTAVFLQELLCRIVFCSCLELVYCFRTFLLLFFQAVGSIIYAVVVICCDARPDEIDAVVY